MKKVFELTEKVDRCPECGGELIPILYGEPTPEAFEEAEKGHIILGGCCIETDENGNFMMPEWECEKCHRQFKMRNEHGKKK